MILVVFFTIVLDTFGWWSSDSGSDLCVDFQINLRNLFWTFWSKPATPQRLHACSCFLKKKTTLPEGMFRTWRRERGFHRWGLQRWFAGACGKCSNISFYKNGFGHQQKKRNGSGCVAASGSQIHVLSFFTFRQSRNCKRSTNWVKRAPTRPKECKREPTGPKKEPKGAKRAPKGARGSQRETKVAKTDPK